MPVRSFWDQYFGKIFLNYFLIWGDRGRSAEHGGGRGIWMRWLKVDQIEVWRSETSPKVRIHPQRGCEFTLIVCFFPKKFRVLKDSTWLNGEYIGWSRMFKYPEHVEEKWGVLSNSGWEPTCLFQAKKLINIALSGRFKVFPWSDLDGNKTKKFSGFFWFEWGQWEVCRTIFLEKYFWIIFWYGKKEGVPLSTVVVAEFESDD